MNSARQTCLMSGATIGIVAPANPLNTITADNIAVGIHNLESLGYQVQFGKAVNCSLKDADSARLRAQDLMDMFADDSISAIMTAIGGYNSLEILPYLDYGKIASSGKPLIGFSDVTALLNAIHQKSGILTYHGPTFAIFCQKQLPGYTVNSFQSMMTSLLPMELKPSETYADDLWYLRNTGIREWKPGSGWKYYNCAPFQGEIVGGNLETLLALAGTPYFPQTKGKVLIIEEANAKQPLAVRREIVQLKIMGVLDEITALVGGRFWGWSRCEEDAFWNDITSTVLSDFRKPILTGLDFGHTDPMCTLPIGGWLKYDGNNLRVYRFPLESN